jgi:hypothetical protein
MRQGAMSGIVHLRIVVTIFVVSGIVSVLPFALSLLMDGVHTSVPSLVGGIGSIAIAIWFSRGSNIARYIMIVYSIFGLLLCGLLLFLLGGNLEWAVLFGVTGALCGYCLWVSMFSKDVRAELSRRREANMKQESDERRKFYEQLGEKSE